MRRKDAQLVRHVIHWFAIGETRLIDSVLGMRRTGVALAVDRSDTHLSYQGADVLAPDLEALPLKHFAQRPCAGEREIQMQCVDPTNHSQIVVGHRLGQVVDVRTRDAHELGLALDRQLMVAIDHFFAVASPMRPSAPAKNHIAARTAPISDQS